MCSIPSSLLSDVEQKTDSLPKGVLTPVDPADVCSLSRSLARRLSATGCEMGVRDAMMERLFAGLSTVLWRACRRVNVSESEEGGSGNENALRSRLVPSVTVMTGLEWWALPSGRPGASSAAAGMDPGAVGSARRGGRASGNLVGDKPALSRRSLVLGGELYMPAGRGEVKGLEVDDEAAP